MYFDLKFKFHELKATLSPNPTVKQIPDTGSSDGLGFMFYVLCFSICRRAILLNKSMNNVAKPFSQIASKRRGKRTRCFNLNSIYYYIFSSYILYFNYLSNEGLFSLFSFFLTLRLLSKSTSSLSARCGGFLTCKMSVSETSAPHCKMIRDPRLEKRLLLLLI